MLQSLHINSYAPYKKSHRPHIISACLTLKNNQDIIITDSDKNLGPVLLNTIDYDILVNKHLSNAAVYKPISITDVNFIYLHCLDTIRQKLSQLSYAFTIKYKKQIQWVLHHSSKPVKVPKFRIIPKLHKTGPLSSRPISGMIQWITTPISTFISAYIQSFIKTISTQILRDSKMLIQRIENKPVSPSAILVSFDVVSLYTNMRHTEVIHYLRKSFQSDDELLLLDLIELTLKSSVIQYKDKFYLQQEGMAMGTNMAPHR